MCCQVSFPINDTATSASPVIFLIASAFSLFDFEASLTTLINSDSFSLSTFAVSMIEVISALVSLMMLDASVEYSSIAIPRALFPECLPLLIVHL